MKKLNVKFVIALLLVAVFFQSCSEDEGFISNESSDVGEIIDDPADLSDSTSSLISDWMTLWLDLDQHTTGMRPNATARSLAYINLAAYETAVFSMENYVSNENKLSGLRISENNRSNNVDVNVALNTCYAEVMTHFMYNVIEGVEAKITQLESSKEATLSVNISNEVLQESKEWGSYIASRIISYAQSDDHAESQIYDPQPLSYEPETGEGYWTYSADPERALFPYWKKVRTFVISSKETSSVPPTDYSENINSDYYAQMKEVYDVNNRAKEEDNEQLWIAEFWSDDVEGLMISPPGRQISIAQQLITQYDLSYERSLALLLKLGFALNDAAVSTWADKYEYMVMRPNVYIHEFIDSEFQTNLYRLVYWPNPSFPGYPSGHSAFASAAGGVFIGEFGDSTNFTDRSHEGRTEFRGTPRTFSTFSAMAEENAFSRIPLGVHIRMDCTEGLRLGYEISDAINNYDLTDSGSR